MLADLKDVQKKRKAEDTKVGFLNICSTLVSSIQWHRVIIVIPKGLKDAIVNQFINWGYLKIMLRVPLTLPIINFYVGNIIVMIINVSVSWK